MEITQLNSKDLNNILSNFDVSSSNSSLERINTGYINDSFYINFKGKRKYVLQKVNTNVFKNVEAIKNNINLIDLRKPGHPPKFPKGSWKKRSLGC